MVAPADLAVVMGDGIARELLRAGKLDRYAAHGLG